MKVDIVTLFPEICRAPLNESMMRRAQEKQIVDVHIHNLGDWTTDKDHMVDDAPFGGGQGMVMKPEPVFAAVEDLRNRLSALNPQLSTKVLLMSPAGRRLDQKLATDLSKESHLIIICEHYEGVDHRVTNHMIDLVSSICDYVFTNGAMHTVALVDVLVSLICT